MDFFINNLTVLLVLLAIASVVALFTILHLSVIKPIIYTGTVSGRISGTKINHSNIPQSIPTKVGMSTMECKSKPHCQAMATRVNSTANIANGLARH